MCICMTAFYACIVSVTCCSNYRVSPVGITTWRFMLDLQYRIVRAARSVPLHVNDKAYPLQYSSGVVKS